MASKILNKRQSMAEYITDAIAASSKSQREIADEMGLDNANIITMYKSGASRVPPNRIYSLAVALGVDAWFMVRLALLEYYPELHAVIERVLPAPILTANETALIKSFRDVTDYSDPEFRFHGCETKVVASYFVNKS